MCSLVLIFSCKGECLHKFFHFFHGFKNGDYKAPSLNFLCFTTLIFHKKYYSEEGPYCAFLANDILWRNREDIQFIFLILACCGLQAKYLYKVHITVQLERGFLSLFEPKPRCRYSVSCPLGGLTSTFAYLRHGLSAFWLLVFCGTLENFSS